jgi:hypothetical protein
VNFLQSQREKAHGLEGLVAKRRGSRYEPGPRYASQLAVRHCNPRHQNRTYQIAGILDMASMLGVGIDKYHNVSF